jgi:hypothetical protein
MTDLGPGPTRSLAVTEKIDREVTGLNGSIFVHTTLQEHGNRYLITSISLSEKSKDGSTLDHVFEALSDVLTSLLQEYQGGAIR